MTATDTAQTIGERLPTRASVPRVVLALGFLISRRRTLHLLAGRYGRVFRIRLPRYRDVVVVADPTTAKQLFTTPADVARNIDPNLGRILGTGSMFALEGSRHRRRRKLLTPPLHGKRIAGYEDVVADEFRRESATWRVGQPFATLQPMMRITLNVILRTVFGAAGHDLDALRKTIPALVTLGSRLAALPDPPQALRRVSPHARFERLRAEYDSIVDTLIGKARRDPHLSDRDDILALMLQSTYDDGSPMSDNEIRDELLTLLAAGHETTATTLAWAVERITRHPDLLDALVAEAKAGGNQLRVATIHEVQRSRPVIDLAGRHIDGDGLTLGDYAVPQGCNVMVAIALLHDDSREFAHPERFDPSRFIDTRPGPAWLPFGGGTRRCIGAAFAHMEMDVVLRLLLTDFTIEVTDEPAEAWRSRGVAYAPRRGGQAHGVCSEYVTCGVFTRSLRQPVESPRRARP